MTELAVEAVKVQVLKLAKVYTVRLLLRKSIFDVNSLILAGLCLLQQEAWILCIYTKKLKDHQHFSKTMQKLKKKLKKLSPMVLRTVKTAKKGIYTTVKFCKKTTKNDDIDEPFIIAWFFVIRLFASVTLKISKNMIRKGRLPKYSFLKKHFLRTASYFAALPLVLLVLCKAF